MVVREFPCESRSLPGATLKSLTLLGGAFSLLLFLHVFLDGGDAMFSGFEQAFYMLAGVDQSTCKENSIFID